MPNPFLQGTPRNQNGTYPPEYYQQPYTGPGGYNPNDPYDPRVGGGALPPGFQGTQNRAYTRTPQSNEMSSSQLMQILRDGGAYIENARQQGREYAGERGSFLSSAAAGAAERAAIESAAPFAMQQAGVYSSTASENMGALNAKQLADLDFAARQGDQNAQVAVAEIGARSALQRQRENLAYEGEQRGLDRSFTQMQDLYNYHYDLGRISQQGRINIQDYAARTGIDAQAQRNIFLNNLYNAAMQDPELFTPEFIGGMYTNYFDAYNDVMGYLDDYLGQFFNDDWFGGF